MQAPRRRKSEGTFTTKSGNSIKVNRSFSGRRAAQKDARARQRAAYLSKLPKNRWKRLLYRLEPKRLYHYWFSRQGGIMALKITGIGIVVCFLLLVGLFAYFRKDLPNITDVSGTNLPGSISYYDSSNKTLLWQDYDAVKRVPVQGNDTSPYMRDASVAIEDKDFYHEGGFNIRGILRATFQDLFHRSQGLQGASTITEQLVKLNGNWIGQRNFTVKIKELILAVELSREYSKADILTGYLNAAPYGGVEYGCESAARDYFHISCKDLSLAQSAMLAAIPQAPGQFSPYSDPKYNPEITSSFFDAQGLIDRQKYILDQMASQGYITKAQADTAKKVDVLAQVKPLSPKYQGIKAPYFVLAAKSQLEQMYGADTVNRGGWQVTTTLNMNLQNKADQVAADNLPNVQQYGGDEEAMVGEQVQTGKIVMEVGGVNFSDPNHGSINYAQTNISPGSSIKPFEYSLLINTSNHAGAGSVLYDSQSALPGYPCTDKTLPPPKGTGNCLWNDDHQYSGPMTLRYALGTSRNVTAVKANLIVGTSKAQQNVDNLMSNPDGYRCYQTNVENFFAVSKADEASCYAASGIGDGAYLYLDDEVNADASLARLGQSIPKTYIEKITAASGHTIYQWTQPKAKQVLRTDAAYIVDNMLSDPKASYLRGSCSTYTCTPLPYGQKWHRYNGWNISIKTGTTNDNYDGLMTAWTTQYAVATWVGYHSRNVAMTAGHMEDMTEPLARNWLQYALDSLHKPATNWKQPSDIKVEPAFNFMVRTRGYYSAILPGPSTDIYPSWYVPASGTTSSSVIDKVSGKLATSCTPAAAKMTLYGGNASSLSVDTFVSGNGSGQYNTSASDDVHNCSDQLPSGTLTVSNSSGTSDTCDKNGCYLTVTANQGTHPLGSSKFPGSIVINVNGKAAKTCSLSASTSSPSPPCTYHYVPTKSGTVTITAYVTDSVLYQSQADGSPVTLQNTLTNGNGGGDGGGGGNPNPGP